MKSQSLKVVSGVMYFLSAVAVAGLIAPSFTTLRFSHGEKFITVFIIFALGFMASRLLCVGADNEKAQIIMKKTFIWLFLVYVLVVIDFTLISESFGRSLSNIFLLDKTQAKKYISENTNFVPLGTIKLYLNAHTKGNIEPYIVAENLLGNFLVFTPFAFFIPIAFCRVKSALKFLVIISLTVVVIEFLQIVFLTGSADIDDFILNVSGAMAAYGVLRIKSVKKFTDKILRKGEAGEG